MIISPKSPFLGKKILKIESEDDIIDIDLSSSLLMEFYIKNKRSKDLYFNNGEIWGNVVRS